MSMNPETSAGLSNKEMRRVGCQYTIGLPANYSKPMTECEMHQISTTGRFAGDGRLFKLYPSQSAGDTVSVSPGEVRMMCGEVLRPMVSLRATSVGIGSVDCLPPLDWIHFVAPQSLQDFLSPAQDTPMITEQEGMSLGRIWTTFVGEPWREDGGGTRCQAAFQVHCTLDVSPLLEECEPSATVSPRGKTVFVITKGAQSVGHGTTNIEVCMPFMPSQLTPEKKRGIWTLENRGRVANNDSADLQFEFTITHVRQISVRQSDGVAFDRVLRGVPSFVFNPFSSASTANEKNAKDKQDGKDDKETTEYLWGIGDKFDIHHNHPGPKTDIKSEPP